MGFSLNSALNELSKRDTLTKGRREIHLPKGEGRYTFRIMIHFSNNDTLIEN